MPISTVIGVLAALIGSTATLLAAWVYVRSKRPPKRELFWATLTIIIIMVSLVGMAVVISRATRISINGQETLPIPGIPAPGQSTPGQSTPASIQTPTPPSTSTSTPTSTPVPTPALTPTPASTPTSAPKSTSVPTP